MPCTQILVHSWNSEQGYRRCFTELTRTLVLSVVQANSPALLKKKTFFDIVQCIDNCFGWENTNLPVKFFFVLNFIFILLCGFRVFLNGNKVPIAEKLVL